MLVVSLGDIDAGDYTTQRRLVTGSGSNISIVSNAGEELAV
jgi:hypothetical protein